MNRKKRIKDILCNYFIGGNIQVNDNSIEHSGHNNFDGTQESHFQILIERKYIKNLSRLEVHRKINSLLKNEFENGMHALEIKII